MLMMSGANWRAMTTALSSVAASCDVPVSMMRPLTEVTLMPPPVSRPISAEMRETS